MPLFDMDATDRESPSKRGAREKEISPFEAIIRAAGGEALPGMYGLGQALVNVWTQEMHGHPALQTTRKVMNSVALYRRWQASQNPPDRVVIIDHVKEFLERNELERPPNMQNLSSMIFAFSSEVPHEDFVPGGKKGEKELETAGDSNVWDVAPGLMRVFKLPKSGVLYYYEVSKSTDETGWCVGPYLKEKDFDVFRQEIATIIWDIHGQQDLQLAMRKVPGQYGREEEKFTLETIGDPGDYVSGNGTWQNVEKLKDRILKLQAQGIPRNIAFHGPPGTGKTTLARTLARNIGGGRALRIELAAISEAGTAGLLQFVDLLQPRVLLFDDIDRNINEVLEILHLFEQVGATSPLRRNGMVVIATINAISTIDPALLRPGRFDEVVELGEPDDALRASIIDYYVSKHAWTPTAEERERLIKATKGFAPADIREVIQCVAVIGASHLDDEIKRVRRQRKYYSGDACDVYLNRKLGRDYDPDKYAEEIDDDAPETVEL